MVASRLRLRAGAVLVRFFEALPALLPAALCLRLVELGHVDQPWSTFAGAALANDALALLRYGFVLLLVALPALLLPTARARTVALGVQWTLLLCVQAALVQYFWSAGVPLGADLFAYSLGEIRTTVGGAAAFSRPLIAALLVALAILWALLPLRERAWWPRAAARTGALWLVASVLTFLLVPDHVLPSDVRSDAVANAVLDKPSYLLDNTLAPWRASHAGAAAPSTAGMTMPWTGADPRYPFLHPERTPDTLGPFFRHADGGPPNIVLVVVEGLGRTFSGPGARLGSFTPFLDQLAARSLYFENFLAGQGRTFAVLPTLLGSTPYGANGFAALGGRMPAHASLVSVLKAHGYRTSFYSGSNLEFDNEGLLLREEGVGQLVSERDFGAPYQRSNDWGYADRDLMEMALQREQAAPAGPALSIIQTTSMHSPFTFPGKAAWMEQVDARLARLGIARDKWPAYAAQREIFASILYTDDALRLFFERAAHLPGYANTIFLVTGDHRLPELPMDTRIERYHVPLIVYSPLLKAPLAIKSISSQFDITPSLLAMLAHGYALPTPRRVTWLGTGLDTEASFRNLHVIPLKQTKTDLADFVSGAVYLAQDQLYTLADGLQTDRIANDAAGARARAQFRSFVAANQAFERTPVLMPSAARADLVAWQDTGRTLRSVPLAAEAGEVGVGGLRGTPGAGELLVEATFTNHGNSLSTTFAPLAVLSDAHGTELAEVTGAPQSLATGAAARVALRLDTRKLPRGTYFLSLLPSNPDTGRPVGIGQYHVEVRW